MTQPDEWKSPYDPPQQPSTPEPGSGPVPEPGSTPASAPSQAGPPSPYQQPYEQPSQQPYYQGPVPYQPEQGQYQPEQGQSYQPQPPQYGAPYTAPPEKNALGVWSLVLGILSVVMLFSCLVGFLAAIPAVITGQLSRKAQREGLADNGGLALGGIITGWVTIGLTILLIVGFAVLFSIPDFREGFFSDTGYSYDY